MQGSVRKRGKTWSYYFDLGIVDGKRKRKEKGGFRTKAEAQEALREILNEFSRCGSVIDESNISVADYFDYWFKEYVMINCKHNTQEYYRTIIDKHIKSALGSYRLKQLSPAVLQEFINKKLLNGFSKSSLSGFHNVLSNALKMAVHPYQMLKESPMQYVKMPKYDKVKDTEDLKTISLEDFKRIINRFPQGTSFYVPLQIAFHTGMRAAEVCGLTWNCVDLENGSIKVEKILIGKGKGIWEFGTPKTKGSNRTIKIGPTLLGILKAHSLYQKENQLKYGPYYTKSDFVCTKENGVNITPDTLKYLSRVVNYELKIDFNFHSLRHTHATMLLEAGANIKDIQKRLGHSRITTTLDTYSHVTDKMEKATVDILESVIS